MTQWEYVKGSEADFREAPEWATYYAEVMTCGKRVTAWESEDGSKYVYDYGCEDAEKNKVFEDGFINWGWGNKPVVIAERRKVDNLQSSVNDANLGDALKEMFKGVPSDAVYDKYNRPCKGVTIDVYDVLVAFNVTNPALQHLIKKALAVGQRGHKDKNEDLNDILASAKRAIELEESKK